MRRTYVIGGAVLIGLLAMGLTAISGGDGQAVAANGAAIEFETASVRDLEEVVTLDGTLGFPEGDPVTSRLKGTITDVADSGTVVGEGDVLFTVDGEPVVFLRGTLPAFRDIGSEPTLRTITAQTGGTITSLPDVDDVIAFNDEALRIDDVPVLVLPGAVPEWRNLDEGDEGRDVEQLETALVGLGYDPGALVVDDLFTYYTDLMIDSWQEEVGLEVDGRFNLADAFFAPTEPVVTQLLVDVGDSVNPGTPIMVIETVPDGSIRSVEDGDRGLTVRMLQNLLLEAGVDPGDADGTFGDDTEDAVIAFQTANGLEATGVADQATWDALIEDSDEASAEADVLQLQEALIRLGYPVPTSGLIDPGTTAAIEAWQADLGAEVDGVVDLGEVIFLPEPVRVTEAILTIGSPVNDGSAVLATSDSASVVLVDLPAEDQDLLSVGLHLVVEMPNGEEVAAIVTEISGIATRTDNGVVFETTIELVDASVGAELDQAPVDVVVVTDSRERVLAVPVTALLALAEGGYAVEVALESGALGLVAVEPGLYADGWVEVVSTGLGAGDRVVVP
jgi:peptidoglycan hydrolase-like protein with peptidoglycan-binding domain